MVSVLQMTPIPKPSPSIISLRAQSTPPSKKMTRPIGNHRVTAPPPSSSYPISTFPRHRSPYTKTRDTPQGKNLRWTAIALVDKLSQQRELLSSAVADDIALAASDDLLLAHPNRDAAAVERNTRRRVYDALKVMVAAGCIQKEGKALRWIGVDDLRQGPCNVPHPRHTAIRVSICKIRRSIASKRGNLSDIQKKIAAFQRFLSKRQEDALTSAPNENKLHFPFVLVKAKTPTVMHSPARKRVRVDTPSKFKLYSESDLICMMVDRRKFRSTGRKSRSSRNVRRQLVRKHSTDASSPSTPPPPPPPSPAELKLNSVQILPEKQLRRGEQFKLVDIALNTISKPVKSVKYVETLSSAVQINQACDLDILDNVKTESYIDCEMPVRYPKEEDEEVLFLEDIGEKENLPEHDLIHGINPIQQSPKTNSTTSEEPDSQFEQLLRKEPLKETFVQDVSMICDEDDLAIPSHAEDIDSREMLMGVIGDKDDPSRIGFDARTADAQPFDRSNRLTQKDS